MALRVTQGLMYGSSIRGMNRTLNDLMESTLQSSTQKKINRPSDDPAGAGRVISYRAELNTLVRYKSNVDQATGWLSTIDSTLSGDGGVQSILTSLQGLELQGATGTVTTENRQQIASSLRGFMDQLINLANAKYNGYHVFAGHKTDQPAYVMGMGVDALDPNSAGPDSAGHYSIGYCDASNRQDPNNTYFKVTGSASGTVLLQAVGSTSGGAPGDQVGADTAIYRCSTDGGKTWIDNIPSTYNPTTGMCEIDTTTGVVVSFNLMDQNGNPKRVTLVDPDNPHSNDNGTWLYVRPAAIYQGDDNDDTHVIPLYGAAAIAPPAAPRTVTAASAVTATATGTYRDPVDVEVLSSDPSRIQYRYSTDGGTTWVENVVTGNPSTIAIPGGELSLSGLPAAGDTFAVSATPTVPFTSTNSPQVEGYFTRDVAVRIDKVDGAQITYSYSLDDGNNWTQATAPITSPTTPNRLPVPGGYLNFGNLAPDASSQFNIHPHRADIDLQIGDSSNITVNMVGKDVFGGLYDYHCDGFDYPITVPGPNMFESIGKLIAMAETGSQQGFQEAMGQMKDVMSLVLTKAAVAGGREDRLISTKAAISNQIYAQEEGLSSVEDVDITELMAKLAMQQTAYNAALKSSSMIMQMSLVNFL